MVAPGTALPSLSGSGKASVFVAVMAGTKAAAAAARAAARALPARAPPAPALKVAGTRGVSSEKVMASERRVARREFLGKAMLRAFGLMNLSLRVGVDRGPSQTKGGQREGVWLGQRYFK